jgi:hypothetical protein
MCSGGGGGCPLVRWSLAHARTRLVGAGMLTDDAVDHRRELFEDPTCSAVSPIIMAAWGRRSD